MKTYIKNPFPLAALSAGFGLMLAGHAAAQTFATLHDFTFTGGDGGNPEAGLILSGNTLYGTSEDTVFKLNTDNTIDATVYQFTGGNTNDAGVYTNAAGFGLEAALLLSGKILYGTAGSGGSYGAGTVFALNTNGTGFTILHTFSALAASPGAAISTNNEGASPLAGLILAGDTLYGTANAGGRYGVGTIFSLNTNGTGFTVLHSFSEPDTNGFNSDGAFPQASLILSDNILYGTARYGGNAGEGTVFAVNTDGTGFTNLHSFGGWASGDGAEPVAELLLSGNKLIGTASGTTSPVGPLNGTVFAINTDGTGYQNLHVFVLDPSGTNSDGLAPSGGLLLSGNTLYGTAYFGGNIPGYLGSGTVFAMDTEGVSFATLYSFSPADPWTGINSDGADPECRLALADSTLYGTTSSGGSSGFGTVFSLSLPPLKVLTTLLPSATNDVAYSQQLLTAYGQPPYRWSLVSGSLPSGLMLATNGVIFGMPTTNGTFNLTVQVTDALSATATQALTLTAGSPPSVVVLTTNNPVFVPIGGTVSLVVSVSGTGPFSYQWQLNGTNLPNGIITTVAGGGNNGLGDGEAATDAELYFPCSVAVDTLGNLFIADNGDHRIREVGTNGIIATVAGVGTAGYSGDGGAATNAELSYPDGVAMDATGNLFATDGGNNDIRKVGTNGIITTVAEVNAPSGVAVDATGNLFIADDYFDVIRKVGTNGIITIVAGNETGGYSGDGGEATNAELYGPSEVAVDATGNLFIADQNNHRIRKVDTNGIITTVAGNGIRGYSGDGGAAINAELSFPEGVAVDATGNLFIADSGNQRIRKVGTSGIITTAAGNGTASYSGDGGAATNAELTYPESVAVDAAGNLFIADTDNNVIREVVFPGPTLVLNNVRFGNGGVYDVVVSSPYGSVTSSNINLTITTPLQVTTVSLPNGTNGFAYSQQLSAVYGQLPYTWKISSGALPLGLTLATNGVISGTPTINGIFHFTVEVTDALSATATQSLKLIVVLGFPIVAIEPSNNPVMIPLGSNVTFAVSVVGPGPFSYQWQLNGTNLPNGIITTVAGNGYVDPSTGQGGYSGDGGTATNAELDHPMGVAVDAAGNFFIADADNYRIRKVNTNKIITTVAGNGNRGYSGDGGAAINAELNSPLSGVAVDATGNLFVADSRNNVIRKVGTNGVITTVVGNGYGAGTFDGGYSGDGGAATNAMLNYPQGVAVDAAGNLFIADSGNYVIRKVGTDGIITTVAGNGTNGFSGDGGAATNAELNGPQGVAVGAGGNLFIADEWNQRIREVRTNGIITTAAGNGYISSEFYGITYGGYSGDGGVATNAELNGPSGVAVDASGNLFIADSDNGRIRKVDTDGIITTVAGNGSDGYSGDGGVAINAELNAPMGVAVDTSGNLFIAEDANYRIRKVVDPGVIPGPTFALNDVGFGNAGAYDVVVSNPYGVVTSSVVNLTITSLLPQVATTALPNATNGVAYFQTLAAFGGQAPYSWTSSSGVLPPGLTLAINGVISGIPTANGTNNFTVKVTDALSATATQPLSLTVLGPPSVTIQPTNSSVTVTIGNNVSFAVSAAGTGPFSYQWQLNGTNLPNGIITTVAGNGIQGYSGDRGAATNAELYYPIGVAVDAIGNQFIADWGNNRIRKVRANGIITTVAGDSGYGYFGDGGAATNAELWGPTGVAVDATGNVFIADSHNNLIRKVGTNAIITTVAGNGTASYSGNGGAAANAELNWPTGVAVDATGNLFIADSENNVIRKVGTNGIITTMAGNGDGAGLGYGGYSGDGGAATNAELNVPEGVAVDAAGNLFIADSWNNRIRKVGANGIITTVAGKGPEGYGTGGYSGDGGAATNAALDLPEGVAVDATGNLFIADWGNNRIRKVGNNGIITTVAGNGYGAGLGYGGYSGDGGAATNAELNGPEGVAVDATGNLFIADTSNDRIRKLVIQGPTLGLNDVEFGNAGAYDVVVSGPYGSVTSSVVNLTVTLPPLLAPQITGNTNFTFLLSGPAGSNYVLQDSTNLLNWSPVSTSTIPVGGSITVSNAISGYNRRFYRVYLQ
jgi:uncharacterized repeat protein (TIGR03803 family)